MTDLPGGWTMLSKDEAIELIKEGKHPQAHEGNEKLDAALVHMTETDQLIWARDQHGVLYMTVLD